MMNNLKNKFITMFGMSAEHRYFTITNLFFILVIMIASFTSLFHVRGFWLITNSPFWATALAISTGLGIIGSMLGSRYTKLTYISFFLILLMEFVGNIFDSFMHIDVQSKGFIAFKQLFEPVFEMVYLPDEGQIIEDIVYMRWVSIVAGAFIPVLVAFTFHMWMKIRDAKAVVDSNPVTAPIVDNTAPIVDNTAPIVDNTAPIVDNTAPIVDNTTPIVDNTTPIVDNTAPIVDNDVLLWSDPAFSGSTWSAGDTLFSSDPFDLSGDTMISGETLVSGSTIIENMLSNDPVTATGETVIVADNEEDKKKALKSLLTRLKTSLKKTFLKKTT